MAVRTKERIPRQHYNPVPPRQSAVATTSTRNVRIQKPVQRMTADDNYDDEEDREVKTSGSIAVVQRHYQRTPLYYDPYPSQEEEEEAPPQRGLSAYQPPPPKKQKHSLFGWIGQHKLLTVGLLLLLFLAGYLSVGAFLTLVQQRINDISYGYPRTFKLYADLNHYGQPSLLIAVNDGGEIKVIETQKGHPERSKIYVVVTLPADQAEIPVTLTIQDINGDGLPDVIVHYNETEFPLYNNGTGFQSQPPVPKK